MGGTAEKLCDAFANSAWVNNLCAEQVNPRIDDFMVGVMDWLQRHGLSEVVQVKGEATLKAIKAKKAAKAPKPVAAPVK